MPKDQASRKVRKGTKSCIECRQRKIRCIWSEGADGCQNCEARGRTCISQVYATGSSDPVKLTSRERIAHLESTVDHLWASLREVEGRVGIDSLGERVQRDETQGGPDAGDGDGDESSDSGATEMSPPNPPAHLRQLFDSGLLGSPHAEYIASRGDKGFHSTSSLNRARKALQQLLPSKEDVAVTEKHVETWMALLRTLFPSSSIFGTGSSMLAQYDHMRDAAADPVGLGNYLLSLAMTVQYLPAVDLRRVSRSISDGPQFVSRVSDTVEQTIILNDFLFGTLEGLEMGLTFLRLQLVRTRIRKVWIGLRRIIALAELIGLPRASYGSETSDPLATHAMPDKYSVEGRRKAASLLWESIRSIDRISGLMFNLPLGTAYYPFPVPETLMVDGKVHPPSALARLAAVAARIQEIDDFHASRRPPHEIFDKVLKIDQDLQVFASMTPADWWAPSAAVGAEQLLQYWHQYMIVRTHVQLATRGDESGQYAYNHMRCLEACRSMAVRYARLRVALPAGFFACRLLDLQALTPALFLLQTSYRPSFSAAPYMQMDSAQSPAALVQGMLATMDTVSDQSSADFAREVSAAIRSVIDLYENSAGGEERTLTLRVPLLGKIQVGRKHAAPKAAAPRMQAPSMNGQGQQTATSTFGGQHATQPSALDAFPPADFDASNSLDWIMEISDDFPFLPDEVNGSDMLSLGPFDPHT